MMLPMLLAEVLAATGVRRALAALYALAALLGTLLTFSRTAGARRRRRNGGRSCSRSLPRGRALADARGRRPGVSSPSSVRTNGPSSGRTGDAQRVRILQTSLALAADSPVLGVGFGINNLEDVFPDRYEARYGERVFRFHSMNQIVDLLVGTGIVGTALALWWAARVGGRALALVPDARRQARAACAPPAPSPRASRSRS